MSTDEEARLAELEKADALKAKIANINKTHFGPDDPDKSIFGRIWDSLRGGTDRAINAKRVAKKAGETGVVDDSVFGLGATIKKGDVRSLDKAFHASDVPHEKIALMNAMLAYPTWVPRQTFISFLQIDMVDPLQTVQTGRILRFFRVDDTEREGRTILQSRSDEEAKVLAEADARLLGWVKQGLLTAEEAQLDPA